MKVLLGLGANVSGPWGAPSATLARAIEELSQAGVQVLRASRLFSTVAMGPGLQNRYLNSVILVTTELSPGALLGFAFVAGADTPEMVP